MSAVKHLAYLGSDPDFYKELSLYVQECGIGKFKINESTYCKGRIVDLMATDIPSIIFVDCTLILDINDLVNEVIYIKRNMALKYVLFAAVFADKASMNANRALLTSGFQLFFIKGCESDSLFRDALYIAFDESSNFPAYTRARKIDMNINVGFEGTIFSIIENQLIVETDLEIPADNLICKIPVFPDLTCCDFVIKNRNSCIINYPMTNSYILELPISGPWDEISSGFLQQDTLDSWKGMNQDLLREEPIFIKVYSRNINLFQEIYSFYDPLKFHISFCDSVDAIALGNELSCKEHPLIFFDMETESDGGTNFNSLFELTAMVTASTGSLPVMICTNNPSSTQAMQKLMNYPNLISFDKRLTGTVWSSLTKSFIERRKKTDQDHFIFKTSDSRRALDVKFEVQLTSITEHEVTFYCSAPLPMFTLLHFILPIEFIAIVVPPIYEIINRSDSNQYMGFINGVDEKSLAILRKFINQIIYSPLPDYSEATISQVISNISLEKNREEILHVQVKNIASEIVQEAKHVETRFKGKTKL